MHFTLIFSCLLCAPLGDGIKAEYVSEGITAQVGGYRPGRVKLAEEAEKVLETPEGLVAPRFGKIELAGKTFGVILDEPTEDDATATLYVDANADGDYTNDPAATWTADHEALAELRRAQGRV